MPSWRPAFPGSFPEESEVEATINPIVESLLFRFYLAGPSGTGGLTDNREVILSRFGMYLGNPD